MTYQELWLLWHPMDGLPPGQTVQEGQKEYGTL